MSDVAIGLGLGGLIFGLLFVYIRRKYESILKSVKQTEKMGVSSIRGDGPVALEGTIRANTTHQSPIGQEDSVLSAWLIKEWNEHGKHSYWNPIAQGITSEKFELEGHTGSVPVEFDDVSHQAEKLFWKFRELNFNPLQDEKTGTAVGNFAAVFEEFPTVLEHDPEEEPDHVYRFIETLSAVDGSKDSITNVIDIGNPHGKRKYKENTLQEGDEIYILGHAESGLGSDPPTITNGETPTVVARMTESELITQLKNQVGLYRKVGHGLLVFGVVCLLYGIF